MKDQHKEEDSLTEETVTQTSALDCVDLTQRGVKRGSEDDADSISKSMSFETASEEEPSNSSGFLNNVFMRSRKKPRTPPRPTTDGVSPTRDEILRQIAKLRNTLATEVLLKFPDLREKSEDELKAIVMRELFATSS